MVFSIANLVLPKLRLPKATIEYYADRINYYNGPYLKQLNQDTLQLYLLCYGGKYREQSEPEMLLWDQCGCLIASIIVYYNAYTLNHLYVNAKSLAEKDLLIALSPGAWVHINMIGYYRFAGINSTR